MSWCWEHRALQFWGKQNRVQTQMLRQHRTIPALRLKHRSGSCGTASALPKCSIMSGCGTRIVLWGQKPLALCDRCPCFGSLFPPLAALTFAASSIICAFGLAFAAPRSPYRHLELCGIALKQTSFLTFQTAPSFQSILCKLQPLTRHSVRHLPYNIGVLPCVNLQLIYLKQL